MASLPYPRRPLRGCSGLRCTNRALVHQHCNPPTEITEHTEAFGGEEPPTDFTDAHRWLGCVGFSHRIHGIHRSFWQRRASHRIHGTHRSFWRRRASHRFHRCSQMVRLRRVLWEDSLVGAWVWQGCHTLLICVYLCNLWENILRQKLLWFLWLLWDDSLVAAWVWQGCHTLLICENLCNLWEDIPHP